MIAQILAVFLGAFLGAQTAQQSDRLARTAVAVPEEEAFRHLIGDRPILRVSVDQAKRIFFSSIRVQVTVDTTGAVTAASALGLEGLQYQEVSLSSDDFAKAESLVQALRYTPFERGGHPVPA